MGLHEVARPPEQDVVRPDDRGWGQGEGARVVSGSVLDVDEGAAHGRHEVRKGARRPREATLVSLIWAESAQCDAFEPTWVLFCQVGSIWAKSLIQFGHICYHHVALLLYLA